MAKYSIYSRNSINGVAEIGNGINDLNLAARRAQKYSNKCGITGFVIDNDTNKRLNHVDQSCLADIPDSIDPTWTTIDGLY